jgi:hypothetical protein
MKMSRMSTLLFAGSLLVSAGAFAGPVNKKTLHLYDKVTVDGKVLPPGDYTIEWSDAGSDVVVNVIQGKQTLASLPAKMVPVNKSNIKDAYSAAVSPDGIRSFTEISFSGKKYNLEIQPSTSASTAQTPSTTGKN